VPVHDVETEGQWYRDPKFCKAFVLEFCALIVHSAPAEDTFLSKGSHLPVRFWALWWHHADRNAERSFGKL